MTDPEDVPLDEAVKRGLIPCAKCGAQGAGVKRLQDGRPHFLCDRCADRTPPPGWLIALILAALLGGAVYWL